MNHIVLCRDDREVFRALLEPGEYVIGRDPDAQIFVDIPDLSRRHARLILLANDLKIEDLGSSNGTFVDDELVSGLVSIAGKNSIRLGDVSLKIQGTQSAGGGTTAASGNSGFLPEELANPIRYVVGSMVAHGGMGNIMDALQKGMRREVAMKVMRRRDDANGLLRFVNEARITGELEHPNIVPVHELGVDEDGQVFYTMKFVRGITLAEVISSLVSSPESAAAKYPIAALLTIFQKVSDAIAFAHSKGVIHRDLKPENIMLGDFGEVLVMDWGLAKRLGSASTEEDDRSESEAHEATENTIAGSILGTPRYMAPEQARGEIDSLDVRTDIYALGTILHEILYLRPLVSAENQFSVLEKVARGERDRVPRNWQSPHLPGGRIPVSLRAVRRKALAFLAADRYQHVADLQADLAAYQAGFATGAEGAGMGTHLALLLKRHRGVSRSIAFGMIALAALSAFYTVRVVGERNRAETALEQEKAALRRVEDTLALVQLAKREANSEKEKAQTALAQAQSERERHLAARAEAARFHGETAAMRNRITEAIKEIPDAEGVYKLLYGESMRAGRVDEALKNIERALLIAPRNPDYLVARANLLQASGRFSQAVPAYRSALAIRSDPQAAASLALTEQILDQRQNSKLGDEDAKRQLDEFLKQQKRLESILLDELFKPEPATSTAEQTPAAAPPPADAPYSPEELGLIEKLKEYTSQPGWRRERIRLLADKQLHLNLDGLKISNLDFLRGSSVRELNVSKTGFTNFGAISSIPLRWLAINDTPSSDISALRGMPLETLYCHNTGVSNLAPLLGMRLRTLSLLNTRVTDLSPLAGMPLQFLDVRFLKVSDLKPLAGMPLEVLWLWGCRDIKDFQSVGTLASLKRVAFSKQASQLGFLKNLPNLQGVYHERWSQNELPAKEFIPLSDASDKAWSILGPELAKTSAKDLRPDRLTVREPRKADLDLRGTGIHDLQALTSFPIYRLLLNTPAPVPDLAPLHAKPELKHLVLSGTKVGEVKPILSQNKISSIVVSRAAKDVHLLADVEGLEHVGYDYNEQTFLPTTKRDEFFMKRIIERGDPVEELPDGCLAVERFDDFKRGDAGWKCSLDAKPSAIGVWAADPQVLMGRGGGCFSALGFPATSRFNWFEAPQPFLGDHLKSIDGGIEFHLRLSEYESGGGKPGIELESLGLRLVRSVELVRMKGWQLVLVPLKDDGEWKIDSLGGQRATLDDLTRVISNLQALRIRADHSSSRGAVTDLDDVIIWNRERFASRQADVAGRKREVEESMAWGGLANIKTSPNLGYHHLRNHSRVHFKQGIPWAEEFDGRHGVAVVHPIGGEGPATIDFPIPAKLPEEMQLAIDIRGSNQPEGNLIRVVGKNGVLASENVDNVWRLIRVPLEKVAGESSLRIEIHARGWYLEHCYINDIRIARFSDLLPPSALAPQQWKYSTTTPVAGWQSQSFDDTAWIGGRGGFGRSGSPLSPVGTEWNSPDIWLRHVFQVPEGTKGRAGLTIFHDEKAEVFINGSPVATLEGYTKTFRDVAVPISLLKPGANLIAIHCNQTNGGQHIDAGVYVEEHP